MRGPLFCPGSEGMLTPSSSLLKKEYLECLDLRSWRTSGSPFPQGAWVQGARLVPRGCWNTRSSRGGAEVPVPPDGV